MNYLTPVGQAFTASASLSFANTSNGLLAAGANLAAVAERLQSGKVKGRRLAPALAAAMVLLSLHPAAAQAAAGGTGSLDTFLTNIVTLITGTTGTAIAIIAVAVCGLGVMFGSMSPRTLGGIVLGVAMIFSAAWIVGKINGTGV